MKESFAKIRPANMRRTHGLRCGHTITGNMSVSAAQCVEEFLADPLQVRESGAGMDAPYDIPAGSIKAFFNEHHGGKHCFGFCQRIVERK